MSLSKESSHDRGSFWDPFGCPRVRFLFCCSDLAGSAYGKLHKDRTDDLDDKIVILTTRVFNGHLFDEYSYDGSYRYFSGRKVVFSPLNSLKSCILVKLCMGNQKSYNETKNIFESFFG